MGCRVMCLLFNPVMYENDGAADRLRRWAVRHTARRACYLAAPSRYMADLVSASTGRECTVAPLGVDHDVFAPAADAGEEILASRISTRTSATISFSTRGFSCPLRDRCFTSWGTLPWIRRPTLPAGSDRNAAAGGLDRVGARNLPDRLVSDYRRARVSSCPQSGRVFACLSRRAWLVAFPRWFAVLSSLRETGGAGARYVDGDDPAEWAAVMRKLLEDRVDHEHMRQAAIQAAARFSWATLAADLAAKL